LGSVISLSSLTFIVVQFVGDMKATLRIFGVRHGGSSKRFLDRFSRVPAPIFVFHWCTLAGTVGLSLGCQDHLFSGLLRGLLFRRGLLSALGLLRGFLFRRGLLSARDLYANCLGFGIPLSSLAFIVVHCTGDQKATLRICGISRGGCTKLFLHRFSRRLARVFVFDCCTLAGTVGLSLGCQDQLFSRGLLRGAACHYANWTRSSLAFSSLTCVVVQFLVVTKATLRRIGILCRGGSAVRSLHRFSRRRAPLCVFDWCTLAGTVGLSTACKDQLLSGLLRGGACRYANWLGIFVSLSSPGIVVKSVVVKNATLRK